MSDTEITAASGYAQEIPGGWVFEVGNEWLTRRIHCVGGRIGTTSLVHNLNGEEYLEETAAEFSFVLSSGEWRLELDFRQFVYTGHATPKWDDEERLLEIQLEAELEGEKLPISVFYQALKGKNYLRKWLQVHPSTSDWIIEWITLENMRFKEAVEGVVPLSRYPDRFTNGEDNVHMQPDKAFVEDPVKRFSFGDISRSVLTYWGFGEGLFFFTQALLGQESFDREIGLLMRQMEYAPISAGFTSSAAIIGAYAGSPEIGFKRYNDYLLDNWCAVGRKEMPVAWDTWLITLEGDKSVFSNYDRNLLLDHVKLLRDAGYYDVLQLDLGWEGGRYLQPDPVKFPKGLSEIVNRARASGLDMGYWINPFSASYWRSDFEDERPEWQTTGPASGRSGAHPLCVMSPYYNYVEKRVQELIIKMNARLIYWDGGDWNIPECTALDHEHENQHELKVEGTKRLARLCEKVHETRPDAVIAAFNLPMDNHRLSALDQELISDTHEHPTIKSELIQRQQIYQMTWEHPYHAIRSGWYGVNWHETGPDNLNRPLRELIHAELSMIGSGVGVAGASFDLKQAKPAFVQFMKKLIAWRKRFEEYFTVYQHILGFPDGESVDGEGHIIDEKGFIILINPTEIEQSVRLPLSEPELELQEGKYYEIFDWSDLDKARPLGKHTLFSEPNIELAPLEIKIFGLDCS